MKIRQTIRHFAAKQALTAPVVGEIARQKLVDLHTRVFLGRADPERANERKDHLEAFFDCTMDTYIAALDAGFSEAAARELTHVQANLDFHAHGWTEMMEFPTDEVGVHYERYADFFARHGITIDDALGEFRSREIPDAPATPEKLERADHPNAEAGFADDVYVEDASGDVTVGGGEEPDDVDMTQSPGLSEER